MLNDGGTATYTGGSGTAALSFSYTVAAGQNVADLAVSSYAFNGATVVGTGNGTAANLTGLVANPAGTLQIDSTVPAVSSLVASGTGITAGTGDVHVGAVVTLTANMSQTVTVSGGTPTLVLNDGGTATYTGGSGTAALTFSYTVAAGQNVADLAVSSYLVNGASVVGTGSGTAANLAGLVANPAGTLQIDTTTTPTGPTVTSLVASGSGITAGTGDVHVGAVVTLTANMSQAVTVTGGTPTLVLNDGGTATYTGGTGTAALTFSYTVAAGQNIADLAVSSVQLNGATVGTGSPTLLPPGTGQSLIDANGHVFSFGAFYNGSTYFILRDGVQEGSGTELALVNGIVWSNTIYGWYSDNGGSFTYQGNAPTLTTGVVADLSGAVTNPAGVLQIDTATVMPTVTSLVASGTGITAGTGDLHLGAVVTLTANMSQAVTVAGGTPTLVLNDGGTATYTGGSGTAALTFSYTVAAGQNVADLAVSSYAVNGATVVGTSSGTTANLTGLVANPVGTLQIDTTTIVPTVSSLVASGIGITAGTGDVHVGAVVTLTANMSQAVTVAGGMPTLVLNDGGTATYTGGSGTAALTFSYTVAAGQNVADLAVSAVQLNGATVGTGSPILLPGSGQSLTDANGHVFSFGAFYNGSTYFILRDGVQEGSGTELALVNGTVWDDTIYGWYIDNSGSFSYHGNAPTLTTGVIADLSGAVTNPAGVLQIDTLTAQSINGETLTGTSVTNTSLANSGSIHVTGTAASLLSGVTISNTSAGAVAIDQGATLDLTNTTISGGSISNAGTLNANSQSNVLNAVAVTNTGTIEATSGSTLVIEAGSLTNNGNLLASGGTLAISNAITGTGTAVISGSNSILEFATTSAQSVTFASGAQGILKLDAAPSYTGSILGLASGDAVDLSNFAFSGNPVISGITGTGAAGTTTNVTVQDAGQSVTLDLLNQSAGQFSTQATAYSLTSDNSANHGTLFQLHS